MPSITWVAWGFGVQFGFRLVREGYQVVWKTEHRFGVQGCYWPTKEDAREMCCSYCSP